MRDFPHTVSFKAADGNLAFLLSAQHVLRSPSLQDHEFSRRNLPEVLAHNPLLFTLSGSKDGILATHDQLLTSRATNNLLDYLRKNAFELGLDTVSKITLSQAPMPPCFTITFANVQTREDLSPIQPVLHSIHLDYSWKKRPNSRSNDDTPTSDLCDDPFSKDLTLPLQSLLDQVIARFVKNGLVRRYPFIFGDLARQFNNEATYFRPMITSVERIVRRSLDPVFRSQCVRLFKLLRHRLTFLSDLADTTEIRARHIGFSTEAAFHLAMQRIFKAGMKCTGFKGNHGYIMDVEELELLETERQETSLPPDQVLSLTQECLLLDQEEDNSAPDYQPRDVSFFAMLDSLHFSSSLALSPRPNTDDMLLDVDSEDDSSLFDLDMSQEPGDEDITVILDESDEDQLQSTVIPRSVDSPAASNNRGVNLPTLPIIKRSRQNAGLVNRLPSIHSCTGFYVERFDRSVPPEAGSAQGPELDHIHTILSNDVLSSHAAQQARSGDTGTSQAKGDTDHMVHPAHWWVQVAPSADLSTAKARTSRPSPSLEHPETPHIVSNDTALHNYPDANSESDGALDPSVQPRDGLCEPRNTVPKSSLGEATVHSKPNLLSHALRHDFLGDPFEEPQAKEECDNDDLNRDDIPSTPHYIVDHLIDEDMITASPDIRNSERPEEPNWGVHFLELVYEEPSGENEVGFQLSQSRCQWEDVGDMDDLLESNDEVTFVEIIA